MRDFNILGFCAPGDALLDLAAHARGLLVAHARALGHVQQGGARHEVRGRGIRALRLRMRARLGFGSPEKGFQATRVPLFVL